MEKTKTNTQRSLWQDAWRRFRKNRTAMAGLIFLCLLVLIAVATVVIDVVTQKEFYNTYVTSQNLVERLKGPSLEHPFGQDEYGRDILTRVLYGARISMWCGVISVGISLIIGTVLGGIAGYYGGVVSIIIMRVMDAMCAFPSLVLAIVIAAAIGKGTVSAMLAVGIVSIPDYARLMFAETSSIRGRPYIEAGVAIGLKNSQLIFRHVLPNCMSQLLVKATLGLGFAILTVSSLSFLGMGVQPPTAEWGNMISEARSYIISGQWWMATFPGLAIMTSILGFNLVGDGVRDIMDPKMKK